MEVVSRNVCWMLKEKLSGGKKDLVEDRASWRFKYARSLITDHRNFSRQ